MDELTRLIHNCLTNTYDLTIFATDSPAKSGVFCLWSKCYGCLKNPHIFVAGGKNTLPYPLRFLRIKIEKKMKIKNKKNQTEIDKDFLFLNQSQTTPFKILKRGLARLYNAILCYLAVRVQSFGYTKCSRPYRENSLATYEERIDMINDIIYTCILAFIIQAILMTTVFIIKKVMIAF